jgi:AbrB family looped-hinge helix DNA binding protein
MEATIDHAGRIVMPKPLRDALGLAPGTKLDVSVCGAGLQIVPAGRTARLMAARFDDVLLPGEDVLTQLPATLGRLGIAGGATYDAVVALAARAHDATLATRDERARATYERVGVRVEVAGAPG